MTLYDDLLSARELLMQSPAFQAHRPLLSPRCGLHDEHDTCRSVICECDCHTTRPAHRTATHDDEGTGR